jgi:hypothetical protein
VFAKSVAAVLFPSSYKEDPKDVSCSNAIVPNPLWVNSRNLISTFSEQDEKKIVNSSGKIKKCHYSVEKRKEILEQQLLHQFNNNKQSFQLHQRKPKFIVFSQNYDNLQVRVATIC